MATTSDIPVTVTDEAKAKMAEWNVQKEYALILDYLKQNVPGLRSIEVVVKYDPATGDHPIIVFDVHQTDPGGEEDPVTWNWIRWMVDTFPSEVLLRFTMLNYYEDPDGR